MCVKRSVIVSPFKTFSAILSLFTIVCFSASVRIRLLTVCSYSCFSSQQNVKTCPDLCEALHLMDQCEEDVAALQDDDEIPSRENQEQEQIQGLTRDVDDGDDKWDTDLETDISTSQPQKLSHAQQYLQACLRTGAIPVSSFLKLEKADLILNHHGVGPQGAKALAIALQTDNIVTNLELEDNNLCAEGVCYLAQMLQKNVTIQSVNLSNNKLQLKGAEVIYKMMLHNNYIKSIKLSGNYFDDSAAKFIAEAFEVNSVVKELDLSHNLFSVTGGEHLGQMLATNAGIEVLNLSWNHFCVGGAVALSAGLKENLTLKQLDLSWNGFGQMEAESLGEALKHNHTLVLLDLSRNLLDDKAVTQLCQGLAVNDTLKVLNLSRNPLTNTGAVTLLTAVKDNSESALEEIDISTVYVNEDFVKLLEEVRQSHSVPEVQYTLMISVTRNLSALRVFQKFFEERDESIMDFFQALDHEGTQQVSTSAFRKAVKDAKLPLDQGQLDWLIRTFDPACTATIQYSQFAELS